MPAKPKVSHDDSLTTESLEYLIDLLTDVASISMELSQRGYFSQPTSAALTNGSILAALELTPILRRKNKHQPKSQPQPLHPILTNHDLLKC